MAENGGLIPHFQAMARNNAWSNHRLYKSCADLDGEALAAPRSSFFPSIIKTLDHILIVDIYYIDVLRETGRALSRYDAEPVSDFTELRAGQSASDALLVRFCDGLSGDACSRQVDVPRPGGIVYRESIGDLLTHLFVHQIHHRGQVHAMLSDAGAAPPQLDEFFLHQDAPLRVGDDYAADWDD